MIKEQDEPLKRYVVALGWSVSNNGRTSKSIKISILYAKSTTEALGKALAQSKKPDSAVLELWNAMLIPSEDVIDDKVIPSKSKS